MCFVNLSLALVKENGHLNHALLTTFPTLLFVQAFRSLSLSLYKIIVVILIRIIFPHKTRLRGLTTQGNKCSVHACLGIPWKMECSLCISWQPRNVELEITTLEKLVLGPRTLSKSLWCWSQPCQGASTPRNLLLCG